MITFQVTNELTVEALLSRHPRDTNLSLSGAQLSSMATRVARKRWQPRGAYQAYNKYWEYKNITKLLCLCVIICFVQYCCSTKTGH